MLVGTIGYACHSGLGHLIRDFVREGVIDRVMYVPHPHYPNHPEWYSTGSPLGRLLFHKRDRLAFLNGLDVLLVFENAFWWELANEAKGRGVKFVVIPNYEYTPYPLPVEPDLILCASQLDEDYYSGKLGNRFGATRIYNTTFLPIPVPRLHQDSWRLRDTAKTFVHNAGHGQRGFAKGTPEIIEAFRKYVKSDAELLVRGQPGEKRINELFANEGGVPCDRITFEYGDLPDEMMYANGDVFINAEHYNGMSLMLQEAWASGMAVMTTDRYPTNTWLAKDTLICPDKIEDDKQAVRFQKHICSPQSIATVVDKWYGRDISGLSSQGREWAKTNSWDALGPKYKEILEAL